MGINEGTVRGTLDIIFRSGPSTVTHPIPLVRMSSSFLLIVLKDPFPYEKTFYTYQ